MIVLVDINSYIYIYTDMLYKFASLFTDLFREVVRGSTPTISPSLEYKIWSKAMADVDKEKTAFSNLSITHEVVLEITN